MLTNTGLVEHVKQALSEGWGYVWGTFGQVLTDTLFRQKLAQYPEGVGRYKDFIAAKWLGKKTTDCVGLIKGYCWTKDNKLTYDSKTDVSADRMYNIAQERGIIATMPDIPGICVWKAGHIGVYIGNGEVIEAHGTKSGVIKTPLSGAGATQWTHWLKCPYITYEVIEDKPTAEAQCKMALEYLIEDEAAKVPAYWDKVLHGLEVVKPEFIAQLIINYHNKLEELKR